jgi:Zn-dependent protease
LPTPFLRFSQVGRNLVRLPPIDVVRVLLAFIVLLFSLTVHESAHAWVADRLGDPTARLLGRVSLNPVVHADLIGTVIFPLVAITTSAPLIGWAKPVPVTVRRLGNPRRDYILVAAAGPVSNLALAIAAALARAPMQQALGESNVAAPIVSMLNLAVELNILLAVFNLIPIPPLDGGNILAGLLPAAAARRLDRVRPYGFLLLYALMLTGGLAYLVGPPSNLLRNLLP